MRFHSWGRRLGWLLWLCLAALAAWRFAGQGADDVYITYRYAYNLAHGRGLVFNPGERVFGVSDPGVAVVLAALHRASGVAIPDLGTALNALSLLAVAGALLGSARAAGREAEAWLAGTALLTSAYVWLGQGSGPLPALALLLLAARQAGARRPWAAGALAGLAFCCRPDAALGAAALAVLLFLEELRGKGEPGSARQRLAAGLKQPLALSSAFAAAAAIGMLSAWSYFGSALPETLAVKRSFAALKPEDFVGSAFWRPAVQIFCALAGPGGLALLALGIAGLAVLFRRGGLAAQLLVAHSLALAAFYTAAAVPFFLWYTIPAAVAVLYGASFVAGEMARRGDVGVGAPGAGRQVRGGAAWRAALYVAAALSAAVIVSSTLAGARWWSAGGSHDWRLFAYRRAGEWLRLNTPPGADIAFDEVGMVGYCSDRPIRDLIGLVSPLSRRYAAAGDPLGAFLAAPPELLLFQTYDHRGGTRPIRDRPWFAAAYAQVAAIHDPAAGAEIVIYRRRPGTAAIPPPRPPWPRRGSLISL